MKRTTLCCTLAALGAGLLFVETGARVTAAGLPAVPAPLPPGLRPALAPAGPTCALRVPSLVPHQPKIGALLAEMRGLDLASLRPIVIPRYEVPKASADVMRVRLQETYDVQGVGTDTVELTGWVAVAHGDPRPARGETEVRWGTTVSDTEFVGLELSGESKLFGPVQVSLDPSQPSVGQVGKLDIPFPAQVALSLAYARAASAGDSSARPARPAPLAQLRPALDAAQSDLTVAQTQVLASMNGLWSAIGAKDPSAMLAFYAPSGTFFNTMVPGQGTASSASYIGTLAQVFDTIDTITVVPDAGTSITISGSQALVKAAGVNHVVDKEGRILQGRWRQSAELLLGANGWRITSDHLSFHNDLSEIQLDACKCVANTAVSIYMPRLDLRMVTAHAAQWYSEVDTIPPVGQTASINLVPTPLLANGRQVATLRSGAIKFREVVRRVWLNEADPRPRGL